MENKRNFWTRTRKFQYQKQINVKNRYYAKKVARILTQLNKTKSTLKSRVKNT